LPNGTQVKALLEITNVGSIASVLSCYCHTGKNAVSPQSFFDGHKYNTDFVLTAISGRNAVGPQLFSVDR